MDVPVATVRSKRATKEQSIDILQMLDIKYATRNEECVHRAGKRAETKGKRLKSWYNKHRWRMHEELETDGERGDGG